MQAPFALHGPPGTRSIATVSVLLLHVVGGPLEAQNPVEGTDWVARTLRPSGQPVIPAFEGWWEQDDGSYELCFGYFSANTEEALDIPLGRRQLHRAARVRRCPADAFRSGAVRTPEVLLHVYGKCAGELSHRRAGGGLDAPCPGAHSYSARGYPRVTGYILNEREAADRSALWEELLARAGPGDDVTRLSPGKRAGVGRSSSFVSSRHPVPEGRGREGVFSGPVTVQVGEGLPLSVSPSGNRTEDHPAGGSGGSSTRVQDRSRSRSIHWRRGRKMRYEASTVVTFDAPGSYSLRVQAIENINSFERHCCWTNGYVEVDVAP